MTRYLLRRLLLAVPTLIIISAVIFAILALAPGDPLGGLATNPNVPPDVQQNIRHQLGLDDPLPVRYMKWAISMVSGQWGTSFMTQTPVRDLVLGRLPVTLAVIGGAYVVSLLVAIPVGVLAGTRQYSVFDQVTTTLAFAGYSLPTFFTGLLLILIFSIRLGWLPFVYVAELQSQGLAWLGDELKQSIMPVAVLALFQAGALTRFMRSAVLDVVREDHVRTARAKGLRESAVLSRHVVRNALMPVVTVIAIQAPTVFTGAIVTEQIFRVPGIGSLLISSIGNNDTPVIMTITFIFAVLVVAANLVADLLYAVLDPRIRYG